MTTKDLKTALLQMIPSDILFSRPCSCPIGDAIDSLRAGENRDVVAEKLVASLGWDGSPAFWFALETGVAA